MGRCPLLRSLALCGLVISSGCATTRPDWTNGDLGEIGKECCFQYRYVLGVARKLSLTDAREAAEISARFEAARSGSMKLDAEIDIRRLQTNVNSQASTLDSITGDLQTDLTGVTIRGWDLYEAYDELLDGNQGYSAWVLYRFEREYARPPPSRLGWAARSAVLPGWGQRARGAKGRGNIFMTSFLGASTSWVLLDQLRNREIDRLNAATTAPEQTAALNKVNLYGDIRNGLLGIVSAIWSISIIDAISGDSQLLPFRVHGSATGGSVNFSVQVPF